LKQQDLINRLRDELTHVVAQTDGNSAMGLTDHNKISENLICGLMREILGFRGLRNLNATEHANYPAIDLADFGARIAVQVTATATLPKIKGTITKFLKHGLQGSFDRLIMYVLSRKQDSYSQGAIEKVAGPQLSFDGKRDILDFRDLLEKRSILILRDLLRRYVSLKLTTAAYRAVLQKRTSIRPRDRPKERPLISCSSFFRKHSISPTSYRSS
jgi:hypothetical protein